MNIADEIRQQIEKCRELKLDVGEINNHLSILEGLVRKDIEERKNEAYQRGYDKGYADKTNNDEVGKELAKDIYQRGLDDAWEAARKLFSSMADSDIEKVFPTEWNNGGFKALMNLQPQEAIEKLKAYEEKQKADDEIKVGDEVRSKRGWTAVVVKIADGGLMLMDSSGAVGSYSDISKFSKTGRHYDIQSILEAMRNDR